MDIAQQLVTAIQAKSLAQVQEILSVTHDTTLFAITTPVIHHAIDDDDVLDIFSVLVKRKFNLAIKDDEHKTVLAHVLPACKQAQFKMLIDIMIKCNGFEAVYNELSTIIDHNPTNVAAVFGVLDLVIWCHENNKPFSTAAMDNAAGHGHLNVVKFLHENRKEGCTCNAMNYAAYDGYLSVVEYLLANTKYDSCFAISMAAENGHFDIVKMLVENGKNCTTRAIDIAARNGHLAVVKFLVENGKECTTSAIDTAARNGYFDVVKFLVENGKECTTNAMDLAAAEGHLDVVKFLVENGTAMCTTKAMDWAAMNGHLDVIKILHEHGKECTCSAANLAALHGHLNVIKWLHANNKEFTCSAIDGAAENGHLDIVMYLYENRTEGCSIEAIDYAASNGHLDICKWLYEHCTKECTSEAMNLAAIGGYINVVKWLHEHCSKFNNIDIALKHAINHDKKDVIEYLTLIKSNNIENTTSKTAQVALKILNIMPSVDANVSSDTMWTTNYIMPSPSQPLVLTLAQARIKNIEIQYFLNLYDMYNNDNIDMHINHHTEIIKIIVDKNDDDLLVELASFKRYLPYFDDTLISKITHASLKLERYDIIKKLYTNSMMLIVDILASLNDEKFIEYVLK